MRTESRTRLRLAVLRAVADVLFGHAGVGLERRQRHGEALLGGKHRRQLRAQLGRFDLDLLRFGLDFFGEASKRLSMLPTSPLKMPLIASPAACMPMSALCTPIAMPASATATTWPRYFSNCARCAASTTTGLPSISRSPAGCDLGLGQVILRGLFVIRPEVNALA